MTKKKILEETNKFIEENDINNILQRINANNKSNSITSDSDWVYIWQDYHILGELLKKLSKYEKNKIKNRESTILRENR